MSDQPILLRTLIDIPERAHTDTFVLKLAEGLAHAEETLKDYVVTTQLAECFAQAMDLIHGAVERNRSEATYLHGSFGSGKSHFMAVLGLLLAGNMRARAIPELASVVSKNNPWIEGKRVLMVPYHMIGAVEVESAILGGYARHVRSLHPDAPVPGFYLGERLFADANSLRATMGDEVFFNRLNEATDSDWGDLAQWDAGSFEAAQLQPAEGAAGSDRQRLVGDLIKRMFTSYASVAAAGTEGFVGLDAGLEIATRHAKALGYDAIILFLDEMILWLASNAANVEMIAREGPKLSKLVEAERMDRPIPVVSFVPRQRDLRELVGVSAAGAVYQQLEEMLNWWNARFRSITLEARNLPVIANRRLLRPRDADARIKLEAAFNRFADRNKQVTDTLLGSEGERALFQLVYPFSPALVETLIAASEVLQRERTALRVMLTMLIERRDDLYLGQLIPVGDLWDVLAAGAEPFSQGMRIQFENARKLWTQKLLPALERRHGVTWQDIEASTAELKRAGDLRNEARLLKTLLLAALIPEVPALRALNAARLNALNHGSVVSPIPGREGNDVLRIIRTLAAEVGEIKLTDDTNPVISLHITGVDIEPILANVGGEDNEANRRRKIREMILKILDQTEDHGLLTGQGFIEYEFDWRRTRRQVDLWLEAVEGLSDERLRGREGAITVILGMPFDTPGHGPRDDRARLDRFKERADTADTVVWLPSPFSQDALRALGTLICIDFLMVRDRLDTAARHLSIADRELARALLQNQQSQLYQRVRAAVEAAFGLRHDQDGSLGQKLEPGDQLVSLDPLFQPRMPTGADLKQALNALLDQELTYKYPAHPIFEADPKRGALRDVLEEVQRAAQEPGQRLEIARAIRPLMSGIAMPLRLGTMSATHFVLDPHWTSHFGRLLAQTDGERMTVGQLRQWMDDPKPMGLPKDVQNLVVLAFGAQADRSFYLRGVSLRPALERIDDDTEVRSQPLPDEATWNTACARARTLFGLTPSLVRKAATVAALADELRSKAEAARAPAAGLLTELRSRMGEFGVDPDTASRTRTLRSAGALLASLTSASDPPEVVAALAEANLETSDAAVAATLATVADLHPFVSSLQWMALRGVKALADHRKTAGAVVAETVADAMKADEHVRPLRPILSKAQEDAFALLAAAPQAAAPATIDRPEARRPPPPGQIVVEERMAADLSGKEALDQLDALRRTVANTPGGKLTLSWRITRTGP